MDNSAIVLLINDNARAIRGQYEEGGTSSIFKTLDPSVKVGDLVVVETKTRHGMTVFKVTEVDIDINFDTERNIGWAIQRVDTDYYSTLLEQEKAAISAVQSAERRRKKEELRKTIFADHEDSIKTLEIANMEGDQVTESTT